MISTFPFRLAAFVSVCFAVVEPSTSIHHTPLQLLLLLLLDQKKVEKSVKINDFEVLDHFPGATKRTWPAESIFAIRFERKLICLGQLLIQRIDL